MANDTWKDVERRVAEITGGRRLPHDFLGGPDVVHDVLTIECKHRAKLPAWLTGAYGQAAKNTPPGKVPAVVLHEKHSRRYLLIVDLTDAVAGIDDVPGGTLIDTMRLARNGDTEAQEWLRMMTPDLID